MEVVAPGAVGRWPSYVGRRMRADLRLLQFRCSGFQLRRNDTQSSCR